jgi:preprotein translocase subunit SecY
VKLVIATFAYESPVWYVIVSILFVLAFLAITIASVIFVIFITGSERRIPVQYAKKNVGRKMYGGQSTHLPLKLNMTGVMPVIFASSIVSLVPTILALCGITSETKSGWGTFAKIIGSDGFIYPIVFLVLIIAFAYFYTQITFNPVEVANNLKVQGGAIPGIRQGRPTADYIRKILNKITLAGAIFLAIIAVVPVLAGPHLIEPLLGWILKGEIPLEWWNYTVGSNEYQTLQNYVSSIEASASSLASVFTFGGTSLIIVVGVALETFRDLEAQLTMRSYKGFLG